MADYWYFLLFAGYATVALHSGRRAYRKMKKKDLKYYPAFGHGAREAFIATLSGVLALIFLGLGFANL